MPFIGEEFNQDSRFYPYKMNGFGDEQHTTDWSFDGVRQHPLFRKFVQYIILKRHIIER